MVQPKPKPRTPLFAVMSVYELRRVFRQVQTTGKVPRVLATDVTRARRRAA